MKLTLTRCFYLKNEDFWLGLIFPLSSKWTERWLLLPLLCAVRATGLFVSLPWQPSSLGPWGIPGPWCQKEELPCSLLPSPPHKSYVLSYLAPIARVSEGIQDLWRISSPTPFTKKGWFPFTSVRGAQASQLSLGLSGQQCGQRVSEANRFYSECA